MNTNCVMMENMPLLFSIANQTMVNALRVNNHPHPPTLMHMCVQYTNICICKTIVLPLTSMAEHIMMEVDFDFALVNGACTNKISVLDQGLGLISS